jgi:hypothetical protein
VLLLRHYSLPIVATAPRQCCRGKIHRVQARDLPGPGKRSTGSRQEIYRVDLPGQSGHDGAMVLSSGEPSFTCATGAAPLAVRAAPLATRPAPLATRAAPLDTRRSSLSPAEQLRPCGGGRLRGRRTRASCERKACNDLRWHVAARGEGHRQDAESTLTRSRRKSRGEAKRAAIAKSHPKTSIVIFKSKNHSATRLKLVPSPIPGGCPRLERGRRGGRGATVPEGVQAPAETGACIGTTNPGTVQTDCCKRFRARRRHVPVLRHKPDR